MNTLKREIDAEAAELRRLLAEIHRTDERRDIDAESYRAWEAACDAFHQHRSAVGDAVGRALDTWSYSDADLLEFVVSYLEADPWYFRSGYMKGVMLTRSKRTALDDAMRRRLEDVLIDAVDRRGFQEFRYYCRLAVVVASTALQPRLEQRVVADASPVRSRAQLMLRHMRYAESRRRLDARRRRSQRQSDPRAMRHDQLVALLESRNSGDRVWAVRVLARRDDAASIAAARDAYVRLSIRSPGTGMALACGSEIEQRLESADDLRWLVSVFADRADEFSRARFGDHFRCFSPDAVLEQLQGLNREHRSSAWTADVDHAIAIAEWRLRAQRQRSSSDLG